MCLSGQIIFQSKTKKDQYEYPGLSLWLLFSCISYLSHLEFGTTIRCSIGWCQSLSFTDGCINIAIISINCLLRSRIDCSHATSPPKRPRIVAIIGSKDQRSLSLSVLFVIDSFSLLDFWRYETCCSCCLPISIERKNWSRNNQRSSSLC